MDQNHWIWNVNAVWENFSSLCQELDYAQSAKNEFFKYHYTKTSLFFAVGTIESFLNQTMRQHMTSAFEAEEKIFNRMKAPLGKKLEKWPLELCGTSISLTNELKEILEDYKDVRNEVTHPKNKDHSIYKRIDEMDTKSLKTLIAEYIISILEARNEPFPYWLLGWNFIGLNGDFNYPCLQDNYQFLWSLRSMGFDIPVGDCAKMDDWIKQNMSTIDGFREALKVMNTIACESKSVNFPSKPRLCKKWWDEQHIIQCEEFSK